MKVRRHVKLILLCSLLSFLALAFSLPGLTASFFTDLELNLEKEVGRNSYESIVAEMKVVTLPEAEMERLNNIFDRLVRVCSRRKELEFSLTCG